MRAAAELLHQPFNGFVVAMLAGRVAVIGSVEGGVDVEGWAVGDGVIEVGAGRGRRAVGDADFDRGVHVKIGCVEGDASGVAVAVEPGGEAGDGFGPAGEGQCPFVDEL